MLRRAKQTKLKLIQESNKRLLNEGNLGGYFDEIDEKLEKIETEFENQGGEVDNNIMKLRQKLFEYLNRFRDSLEKSHGGGHDDHEDDHHHDKPHGNNKGINAMARSRSTSVKI